MVIVKPGYSASTRIVDILTRSVGDTIFENMSLAINRLEELGFQGCDICECRFIPVEEAIKNGKTTIKISAKEL